MDEERAEQPEPQSSRGQNTDPQTPRLWRRLATVERLQTVFNGFLVLVTAGQATVSYYQWGLTRDSLRFTQQAVDIAERQVKTAQEANKLARASSKSADEMAQQTLLANQRAWVGPTGARLENAPAVGKQLGFFIDYQNTGREPARNVEQFIENAHR